MGGSTGHTTIPLARAFPDLKVVVQDLSDAFDKAKDLVPVDLQGRIEFMKHDFFQPQPVEGADVYLLRWILHDWSDAYCVKILRALKPALKKDARVLIAEGIMPPRGVLPLSQERFLT